MEAVILKVGGTYKKHYFDNTDTSSELSIGRAFSNDIIIADPYVDTTQLSVQRNADEAYDWHIKITDHTNPVFLNNRNVECSEFFSHSGDEITIGRTSICFYTEDHPLPVTREFSFTNWLHNHKFKPFIAGLMLLLLFGFSLLMSHQETTSKVDWGELSVTAFIVVLFAIFWSSAWSFSGRLLKGDYYFFSHLFFTSLCFTLIMVTSDVSSYIDYMFSSPFAGQISDWSIAIVLMGLLLGFNLTLVTNSPKAVWRGFIASVCIAGIIAVLVKINDKDYDNKPTHSVTIKPSYIPTTSPISVKEYITNYDEMFDQLSSLQHESMNPK